MHTLQKVQVEKAVALFKAMGLQYHIKCEEAEWGAPIAAAKPQRAKRKDFSALDLTSRVAEMTVADVLVISNEECANNGFLLDEVAANVSSRGVQIFGKGNFTTSIKTGHVEAMRLG